MAPAVWRGCHDSAPGGLAMASVRRWTAAARERFRRIVLDRTIWLRFAPGFVFTPCYNRRVLGRGRGDAGRRPECHRLASPTPVRVAVRGGREAARREIVAGSSDWDARSPLRPDRAAWRLMTASLRQADRDRPAVRSRGSAGAKRNSVASDRSLRSGGTDGHAAELGAHIQR